MMFAPLVKEEDVKCSPRYEILAGRGIYPEVPKDKLKQTVQIMETEKSNRKATKEDLIHYAVSNIRRVVMCSGVLNTDGSEFNSVIESIVDGAMSIAESRSERSELLTIEDCVKRAREIAKSRMNCDVKITITYGD